MLYILVFQILDQMQLFFPGQVPAYLVVDIRIFLDFRDLFYPDIRPMADQSLDYLYIILEKRVVKRGPVKIVENVDIELGI